MVSVWATGRQRQRAMIVQDNSRRDYLVIAVSMAVAAIFIYAGIDKLRDPMQFADSIEGFAILPVALISLLSLSLPPYEVASGLLLLWPRTRRIGALAVAAVSMVFFAALASALIRGLTLDCGCFGVGAPSRPRMWLELALDVLLFSGALFVYLRSITRLSTPAPALSD
jgi:putative oxidoreductase